MNNKYTGGEGVWESIISKCRLKTQVIFCNSNVFIPQLIKYVYLTKLFVKKQMLILLRASQVFTPKDFEQKHNPSWIKIKWH